jgi:hypothetical protein
VDEWGIHYEDAPSTVIVKYSTTEFINGNSEQSEINGWEKQAQSARPVIQFGCLDASGEGVEMCRFTG